MNTGNYMIDGDPGDHPMSPNYKEPPECPECDGAGTLYVSCCGDDLTLVEGWPEIDVCPTCREHCDVEGEPCENCHGEGVLIDEEYDE